MNYKAIVYSSILILTSAAQPVVASPSIGCGRSATQAVEVALTKEGLRTRTRRIFPFGFRGKSVPILGIRRPHPLSKVRSFFP